MDLQFYALATRAAVAANLDGDNPVYAWLNRLRDSPRAHRVEYESYAGDQCSRIETRIEISRLTIASAELCVELETEAFEQSRTARSAGASEGKPAASDGRPTAASGGRRMAGGPRLAAWLRERMNREDLSNHRVAKLCEMDPKTVEKILSADRVRSMAISKLAKGLGVDQGSLPRD